MFTSLDIWGTKKWKLFLDSFNVNFETTGQTLLSDTHYLFLTSALRERVFELVFEFQAGALLRTLGIGWVRFENMEVVCLDSSIVQILLKKICRNSKIIFTFLSSVEIIILHICLNYLQLQCNNNTLRQVGTPLWHYYMHGCSLSPASAPYSTYMSDQNNSCCQSLYTWKLMQVRGDIDIYFSQ